MSSGARVSIPNSVRKTIQNIKEIAGNHSEDEIYAMLKECSMDPNETAQKLLLQELRWRPGMQGRGSRGGRGNYSSRYIPNDTTGGKNFVHAKENGINKISEKGIGLSLLPVSQETQNVEITPATSSLTCITSGSTAGSPGSTVGIAHLSAGCFVDPSEGGSAIGTTSEFGSSAMQGTLPSESTGVQKNQLSDSAQPASSSSAHCGSSVIRPSSNCNGRLQQAVGPQKGSSKEWKPKPNPNLGQGSETAGSSEVPAIVEANIQSCPVSSVLDSKEATINLQRKLEELHISDQHVIIPNHLHVPEAEKIGFCFGSFASFDLRTGCNSGHENGGNPKPLSETYETVEEMAEHSSSDQNELETTLEEDDCPEHPQSPRHVAENLSPDEGDVSTTAVPEYSESKQETALSPRNHQYSMIHTSPNYSFGFLPPMVGSRLAPFESSDSQTRVVCI
ncbi:hypothetical protein U1Q18_024304 [Sarracenia purpurea var. burkii]